MADRAGVTLSECHRGRRSCRSCRDPRPRAKKGRSTNHRPRTPPPGDTEIDRMACSTEEQGAPHYKRPRRACQEHRRLEITWALLFCLAWDEVESVLAGFDSIGGRSTVHSGRIRNPLRLHVDTTFWA